jgi:type II secretory pathway component PulJ
MKPFHQNKKNDPKKGREGDVNDDDIFMLDDEEVNTAIQCLTKSIRKLLHRHEEKRTRKRNSEERRRNNGNIDDDQNDEYDRVVMYDDNRNHELPKSIHHILQQIQYCITKLRKQVQSLQAAIQCLTKRLHPIIVQQIAEAVVGTIQSSSSGSSNRSADSTTNRTSAQLLQQRLHHLFLQILRLQDGIIYCVSGECRHPGDVEQTQSSNPQRFQSRLNNNKNTNEKVTNTGSSSSMYSSSNVYSGTSWDEYMDSTIGLHVRLLRHLKQHILTKSSSDRIWEKLGDSGTAPLDNIINTIEITMKDAKDTMTRYCKHQLPNELNRHVLRSKASSNCTFNLILTDKLEKFNVTIGSFFSCQLERYGNDFQVRDRHGVLPLHWKTPENWWNNAMKPATIFIVVDDAMCTTVNPDIMNDKSRLEKNHTKSSKKALTTKQRRVIVDSSSDDESREDETNRNSHRMNDCIESTSNTASKKRGRDTCVCAEHDSENVGLVIRVQNTQKESNVNADRNTLSVAAIKEQLGFDNAALEAARECVEAEEAQTTQEAAMIDNGVDVATVVGTGFGHNNDDNDDISKNQVAHQIASCENNVLRCKRVLRKELSRLSHFDEYTIWDARETLRQATMEAGNVLLWSTPPLPSCSSIPQTIASKRYLIERSIRYFLDAKNLVTEQQSLHHEMISKRLADSRNDRNDQIDSDRGDSIFLRRNLLLLKGQAVNNVGVAYVELATCFFASMSQPKLKKKKEGILVQAVLYLNEAIEATAEIKALCDISLNTDKSNEKNDILEAKLDTLKALQLESLALRWKATVAWQMSQRKESGKLFTAAASYSLLTHGAMDIGDDEALQEALLECRVECYYSWTQLADLCTEMLDRASVDSIRSSPSLYDEIIGLLTKALKSAATESQELYNSIDSCAWLERFRSICRKRDVRISTDLVASLKEVLVGWESKKRYSVAVIGPSSTRENGVGAYLHVRSELQNSMDIPRLPTKLYTLLENGNRRNKMPKYVEGGVYNFIGTMHSDCSSGTINKPKEIQYTKWGDDLLPQRIDEKGRSVPQLEYPAIAPEMPQEIKDMLVKYRLQQQQA